MSGTLLKAAISAVLAFHGVGQAMGIIAGLQLPFITSKDWAQNWTGHSWLLTPLIGDTASRAVCIVLFALPFIGFIGSALALLGWGVPHGLWRPLAIASAAVSLLALTLFWNALLLLFPHKVGDIAVNVAVLVCLALLNWPVESDLGF